MEVTINKTKSLSLASCEFQVLMSLDQIPIATAGIYNHVGLLDKVPRLKTHKNWLALVYTIPEFRGKGLGAMLCDYVQDHAKSLGLEQLYLFTDTAESLYRRLGWQELERIQLPGRKIVVMNKCL